MAQALGAVRVIDLSTGIAGAYAAKLLADTGADVIKVEPSAGDPWRAWTAGGAPADAPIDAAEGGALFRFLHHGVRSVIGEPSDAHVLDLIASADLVIESFPASVIDELHLPERFPGLVILSITPYGRTGPYAERPTTEFIVQAESGGLIGRGGPDQPPIFAGGRISEWVSGTFAAVAATAAVLRAQDTGHGEHIDYAISETMTISGGNYAEYSYQLAGSPPITKVHRTFETPSIEPTLDGYVGVCTNSRQQFDDFLVLIERFDLMGDDDIAKATTRQTRWKEWNDIVHEWTTRYRTADIVRMASDLRIPVAPVHSGENITQCEHFVAREIFVSDPTGSFTMPRRPWRRNDEDPPPPSPAPRLGQHSGTIEPRTPPRPPTPQGECRLPLDGIRVLDLTAWWAGPISAGLIAALGADVIHVESTGRPDGMRMSGGVLGTDGPWWERSSHYLCSNTNKRNLTLDLVSARGLELLRELITHSDAIIENFTPRVMDNFGLSWDVIHEINPSCVLVRMPAFGLSGPWRDNTGFAQTMEQVTGLAWITGHEWDQPRIQRGPSDPNAGMHAAFALLAGLAERRVTGEGSLLEVTMVEGALNAAAELVLEYSAYGNTLERAGNKGPNVAPQGLYRGAGFDNWLALSIATDEQWRALRSALGEPQWACDPALDSYAGRRAHHGMIDAELDAWAADRDVFATAETLVAAGIPAAAGRDPRLLIDHPQLVHRRFHETIDHPVVGVRHTPTVPFRFASVECWLRSPAPLLGQHNHEILGGLLGLSDAELAQLEADQIIGTRPRGV